MRTQVNEPAMKRRDFLKLAGCVPLASGVAWASAPASATCRNLLVLIELKGGNDGLNTLVPYANPAYYALRPNLAIPADQVVRLTDKVGLHHALAPLLPLWNNCELAVLQGVGYPEPNLSHFRSIEIWDTASKSSEYLQEGWLTRTFATAPTPQEFAADGVIIGSPDLGPLAGGTRAIALANTEQFLRQSRLAVAEGEAGNKALEHILKVEADIMQAASHLNADYAFRTEFPQGAFGNAIKTASQVIANRAGVAVVRVTLTGFDTHSGQPSTQARLLGELAGGIVALKSALDELGRWNHTLVLTYAEFGRRPATRSAARSRRCRFFAPERGSRDRVARRASTTRDTRVTRRAGWRPRRRGTRASAAPSRRRSSRGRARLRSRIPPATAFRAATGSAGTADTC